MWQQNYLGVGGHLVLDLQAAQLPFPDLVTGEVVDMFHGRYLLAERTDTLGA